jgi:hypothetical protein
LNSPVINIEENFHDSVYIIYEYCPIKIDSEQSEFLPYFKNYILQLKGGDQELDQLNQELEEVKRQAKLIKSVISKSKGLDDSKGEISLNKYLSKLLKLLDPIFSDTKILRVLSELNKPVKTRFFITDTFNDSPIIKKQSFIFADAFTREVRFYPRQPRRVYPRVIQFEMTKEDFEGLGLTNYQNKL